MVSTNYIQKDGSITSTIDDRFRDEKCNKCGYVGLWYEWHNSTQPIKCGHCGNELNLNTKF